MKCHATLFAVAMLAIPGAAAPGIEQAAPGTEQAAPGTEQAASAPAVLRVAPPAPACDWDTGAMRDCSLSFARPVTEVISTASVRSMALSNVSVSVAEDGDPPLVRSWDGSVPELSLQDVTGASPEPAFGEGPYSCPMRGNP